MTTYEVNLELKSGHTIHLLVAAMSEAEAIADADKVLRQSFRALGPSSVVSAEWRFDEIVAHPVIVAPVGSRLAAALITHPA